MPTPLQILLDPVSLTVLGLYGALILLEALFPARRLPQIKGWKSRALVVFVFYFYLSSYLPLLWGETLAQYQVADLQGLNPFVGAAIGVLVYEFLVYVWHRTMHRVHWIWRAFHQMHHSAERLDTFGAFWFSPLDMIGWTVLFSLSMTLAGFTPQAVTLVLLITTFLSVFQHANIRTPRWLGYIVQRPESHSRHHARDLHAGNYGDLPVFDMLFGTFHNPPDFSAEAGFYPGASARIVDMLLFRDVSKPRS